MARICVWRTGHPIADTVAFAVQDILKSTTKHSIKCHHVDEVERIADYDIHVGYGILRGMADILQGCKASGVPFFLIDRGYWQPDHYHGFYRISHNHTQQIGGPIPSDGTRWKALGLEVCRWKPRDTSKPVLICPPTEHVAAWPNGS